MMLCAIAGVVSNESSVWAQVAEAVLEYPFYLNPVSIGSNGLIDLSASTDGSSIGGLIVPDSTSGAFGLGFLNPNSGQAEYGPQAAFDAIAIGGGTVNPGTVTYTGPTNAGIATDLSHSNSVAASNTTVGYVDNATLADPYTTWRGINLPAITGGALGTAANGGVPVLLISPTWVGDSDLRGVVDLNDYVNWSSGYMNGLTGWQNGDFLYEGKVTLDDYLAWASVYMNYPDVPYPGFGANTSLAQPAGSAIAGNSITAVPEPGTGCLLVTAGLAAIAFRSGRRIKSLKS
jgi:hypothetical protein